MHGQKWRRADEREDGRIPFSFTLHTLSIFSIQRPRFPKTLTCTTKIFSCAPFTKRKSSAAYWQPTRVIDNKNLQPTNYQLSFHFNYPDSFNLTVKIVFLPTPQCFSLEARFSKRTVRIWYISPHPTTTNRGDKRTVPTKKLKKSPVAKVGPISLTYLFERIKSDRYGCVQFLIRRIKIREGKYFFKEN